MVFEKKKAPCLTVCYSPKKTLKNLCLTCYVPVSGQGFLPRVTKKVGGVKGRDYHPVEERQTEKACTQLYRADVKNRFDRK